ncbi:MAG: zinc ribbon domain-containing protein [Clostridia bacterium]|nr:zinc ribbon domain-containing protein [Clostridia bacterium]
MKTCSSCGTPAEDSVKFCTNCGAELPDHAQTAAPTVIDGQNTAPVDAQPVVQAASVPYGMPEQPVSAAQPGKKRMKNSTIILIAVLCSVVLGLGNWAVTRSVLNSVALKMNDLSDFANVPKSDLPAVTRLPSDAQEGNDASSEPSVRVEGLSGDVYTNTWANLKFVLPAGYVEADQEYYDSYDDGGTTVCDLYLISQTGDSLAVAVVNIAPQSDLSPEDEQSYLIDYLRGIEEVFDEEDIDNDIADAQIEAVTLAGESYYKVDFSMTYYGATVAYTTYLRSIDDQIVLLNLTGASYTHNHAIAEKFEPVQ